MCLAGTKRLNISRDIMKVRVSSNDGHILGMSDKEEWVKDVEHDDPDEAHKLASAPLHCRSSAAPPQPLACKPKVSKPSEAWNAPAAEPQYM